MMKGVFLTAMSVKAGMRTGQTKGNGRKPLLALIASGILVLALPLHAFGWSDVDDSMLDPGKQFRILPKTWDKLYGNGGRWPKYGLQPKTAEDIREETVAAIVHAAHQLMKQGKYNEALAKLHELDSMQGKTLDDIYLIERTRLAIAYMLGDKDLMLQAALAAIATGRAPAEDQLDLEDFLAHAYYTQKNYAQAIPWFARYLKEGGSDVNMRDALAKAYYFNNDYAHAANLARSDIEADEKAGKTPAERLFSLWFRAASKLNDQAERIAALEKTVAYYPQKEYWAELLGTLVSRPGFSDTLSFDAYRFMYATGQIDNTQDYVDMAQAALQTGHAAEARLVLEQGFGAGVLGRGPQAAAHRQLRDTAIKSAAAQAKELDKEAASAAQNKAGEILVGVGERCVDQGDVEKGIGLMEQGIRLGNFKRLDEARLRLGVAYATANRKDDAVRMLKTVAGKDGSADLARYWIIHLEAKA